MVFKSLKTLPNITCHYNNELNITIVLRVKFNVVLNKLDKTKKITTIRETHFGIFVIMLW